MRGELKFDANVSMPFLKDVNILGNKMAKAFKHAVISGRESYLAGRMKKNYFASPSSPMDGLI